MNTRAALAILLASGTISQAQGIYHISYSWSEVIAGTATPVSSPNSILEPGEGAMIRVHAFATINGQNAIGQTLPYSGPGGGVATARGLGAVVFSLVGSGADAMGAWSNRGITPVFSAALDNGYIHMGGARVDSFGGCQWLPPGSTANGTNPINSVWRGVWNPSSYSNRTVHFTVEPSDAVPPGQQNALYCRLRTEYVDPGDPSTAYDVFVCIYCQSDFGSGIDIPVDDLSFRPHPGGSGNPLTLAGSCYANCDHSTVSPVLNVNDFQCFINAFAAGQAYANCDNSTAIPALNVNDFQCFLNKFAAGCV